MAQNSALIIRNTSGLPALTGDRGLIAYFEEIKKFPVLTEEEEQHLMYDFKCKGDMQAAQKLVTSHLRLAAKIALSYRSYGLAMADIISEANLGLMQAVKKFDISKKVKLATYAVWWIKAFINDYILRSWSLVKIGTKAAQKKLFYNLSKIKSRLGLYENRALDTQTVKQIAKELVVEEADVIEMNDRIRGDSSLNVTVSDDDELEIIDSIADKTQNLEASYAAKEMSAYRKKVISAALNKLNPREAQIISLRMLTSEPLTLEEIGAKFGISRERVRQIEQVAFAKLSTLVKQEMGEASW